jgi:hypothetical protein
MLLLLVLLVLLRLCLQVYDLYQQGPRGLSWGVSTGWDSMDTCYKVSRLVMRTSDACMQSTRHVKLTLRKQGRHSTRMHTACVPATQDSKQQVVPDRCGAGSLS